MNAPGRGDVWLADRNPSRGHEQSGRRPVLVVSEDPFNEGPARLVVVLPMTRTLRPIRSHVRILPPEGGVKTESAILCEAVRSISADRLVERWGAVGPSTMERVADCLRILLRL